MLSTQHLLCSLCILPLLDFCVGQLALPVIPTYTIALESGLRRELFVTNNYEVHQRPEEQVNVTICLTILTVNGLNIKDQMLSVSGYLSINWFDGRLKWSNPSSTSQDYTYINYLFSTEDFVWRPSLVIENSIREMGVINNKYIPMRIAKHGNITWNPSGIYDVSCESDTTFYPLDTQFCTIVVSSWAYTTSEVELSLAEKSVILDFYVENGEWELIEAYGEKSNDTSIDGTSFSSVTFNFKLQRRPLFHIVNTLVPVGTVALLICMVFRLPADSGEKNGFALTVLLAYAVYLSIISENIPSTSVSVCYLSIYLLFVLCLGALSVPLTILVLSIHFKSETEMIPRWVVLLFQNGNQACQVSDADSLEKLDIDTVEEERLTWQRIAAKLDTFFFWSYMFVIFAVSIAMIIVFTLHFKSLL